MKKLLVTIFSAAMILPLVACGGEKSANSGTDKTTTAQGDEVKKPSASQDASEGIASAKDGEISLGKEDIAVVINGKKVPMPYNLVELEEAGVPVSEMIREDKLGSGESFSLNLYLDENEDYLLIPDYYNDGDDEVALISAEAKTISMVSYASEPADQGVSILGLTYGMTKSDVKAMLGEPMNDNGDNCEWQIVVKDADYVGNLNIYFTDDGDSAGASEIRLDFMEW